MIVRPFFSLVVIEPSLFVVVEIIVVEGVLEICTEGLAVLSLGNGLLLSLLPVVGEACTLVVELGCGVRIVTGG